MSAVVNDNFSPEQYAWPPFKLEYLAVYGRTSMGESRLLDYSGFAFCVLASFCELLTHGQPWILIWAYLIWNFAPIFGQQISILDPPPLHWTFWYVLVWTFTLWVNCKGGGRSGW